MVAETISKAEARFKDQLLDMRAQFGLLAKPWSHKDVVPVGPAALCWAFDDAQKVADFHDDVRKELFNIFSESLHDGLEKLYAALAKLFEDSGAIPSLEELRESLQPKYTIRNRAGVTVSPADYQNMDHATREAVMAAEGMGPGRVDANPFEVPSISGAPAFSTARSLLDISRHSQSLSLWLD